MAEVFTPWNSAMSSGQSPERLRRIDVPARRPRTGMAAVYGSLTRSVSADVRLFHRVDLVETHRRPQLPVIGVSVQGPRRCEHKADENHHESNSEGNDGDEEDRVEGPGEVLSKGHVPKLSESTHSHQRGSPERHRACFHHGRRRRRLV